MGFFLRGLYNACVGAGKPNCGPDKIEWRARRGTCAEAALKSQSLDAETLVEALEQLQHDIDPGDTPGEEWHLTTCKLCTGHFCRLLWQRDAW